MLTFDAICKLDPMVLSIFEEASAFRVLFEDGRAGRTFSPERAAKLHSDPNFCRTQLWRSLPRERGEAGLKFLLKQRVGYSAKGRPELATEEAYTICYRAICDAMPACTHEPGKEWTVEGPEYLDGVQHGQENMCIYNYPVPPIDPETQKKVDAGTYIVGKRETKRAGFSSLIGMMRHAAGTGPEPKPVPGTGEDWKDWQGKMEPRNEPVYIVRSDDEKWALWYTLLDERWQRGTLSKWYAHNAVWVCDHETRKKILAIDHLTLDSPLCWKPVILTFKDEELAKKLSTACTEVFTVENPQSLEDVYKEIAKYAPLPTLTHLVETVPAFPRLPGALGQLVDAISQDLPYDHKALAALTYMGIALSGRVRLLSDRWLQTRFYSCMVGPPGSGKSAPDMEVRRALFDTPCDSLESESPSVLTDVRLEMSIDSGPALVQALAEFPRMILAPDELADQFEKAKITGTGKNSLFGEFLRLYEGNKTANRTKKSRGEGGLTEVSNAMIALLGSVTTTRFEAMWNGVGGVSSGLQSRFVYSYSEKVPPRIKTPNDEQSIMAALTDLYSIVHDASENPVELILSEGATKALYNWRALESDAEESKIRIVDMAKRFAMLIAACNRATVVDEATMRLGLAFADYQIALREKLCAPDASSAVQAFEHAILKAFERNPRMSENQVRNWIKPAKRRGGFAAYNQAFNALRTARQIVPVGKTQREEVVWEAAA